MAGSEVVNGFFVSVNESQSSKTTEGCGGNAQERNKARTSRGFCFTGAVTLGVGSDDSSVPRSAPLPFWKEVGS